MIHVTINMRLICELLNQHIIINWIYPRRILFKSYEEHPWSHSPYTDSIGKWNISHMQGSFTSTVWCHIYHNAEVYYKHHRIIEFITYMAFLHNSTTILAQSAPLNSTLSTAFSVVSKGPISQGWHLFTKEDFLCVCISSTNKHFICLWASKFPVERNGTKAQFKRTAEENAEGWLTGKQLHTLNQTQGNIQINPHTHKSTYTYCKC